MKTLLDCIHPNELSVLSRELVRKLNKAGHVKFVKNIGIGMDDSSIFIDLDNGNQPIPYETQKFIIDETRKFLNIRKKENKISIEDIKNLPIKIVDQDLTPKTILLILNNLRPFGAPLFKDFMSQHGKKCHGKKMEFILPLIEKAVFTEEFFTHFPIYRKHKNITDAAILGPLFCQIRNKHVKANNKMSSSVDELNNQLRHYMPVELIDNVYHFDHTQLISYFANNSMPVHTKWSHVKTWQSYFEDVAEETHNLLNIINVCHQEMTVILKSLTNFINIFDGISEHDIARVMGSSQSIIDIPTLEFVREAIQFILIDINGLNHNIQSWSKAISLCQLVMPVELNVPEKNIPISEPAVKTLFVEENPHAFFSLQSVPSQTVISKSEGELILKKKQEKALKKSQKPRTGAISEVSTNEAAIKISQNEIFEPVYYLLNQTEFFSSKMYRLTCTGMKHVYMCPDLEHLNLEKTQEIIFSKIAHSNVMLSRLTTGENGLRIYGSNVMALISCCKSTNGKRIICAPYPLNNSGLIVYRPIKVLSHDDYETLLKKPALLERKIQYSLSKMEAYLQDPRECSSDFRNGLGMS